MTQRLTISEMVTKVALRIGLRVTQAPVGSTDLKIQQLVELFNEEVYELGTQFRWQLLTHEITFDTSAAQDQGVFEGGIVPASQLLNYIISDTMWNRTARQPIIGPNTTEDWQAKLALQYTSGPFPQYRIRENRLLMTPTPAAAQTIAFEIATKKFVYNPNDDTYGAEFSDNDEVPVLDCDIIMAGVRWRWKQAKGFAYAEDKRTWERAATNAAGRGTGNQKLSLAGGNTVMAGGRGGDLTTRAI